MRAVSVLAGAAVARAAYVPFHSPEHSPDHEHHGADPCDDRSHHPVITPDPVRPGSYPWDQDEFFKNDDDHVPDPTHPETVTETVTVTETETACPHADDHGNEPCTKKKVVTVTYCPDEDPQTTKWVVKCEGHEDGGCPYGGDHPTATTHVVKETEPPAPVCEGDDCDKPHAPHPESTPEPHAPSHDGSPEHDDPHAPHGEHKHIENSPQEHDPHAPHDEHKHIENSPQEHDPHAPSHEGSPEHHDPHAPDEQKYIENSPQQHDPHAPYEGSPEQHDPHDPLDQHIESSPQPGPHHDVHPAPNATHSGNEECVENVSYEPCEGEQCELYYKHCENGKCHGYHDPHCEGDEDEECPKKRYEYCGGDQCPEYYEHCDGPMCYGYTGPQCEGEACDVEPYHHCVENFCYGLVHPAVDHVVCHPINGTTGVNTTDPEHDAPTDPEDDDPTDPDDAENNFVDAAPLASGVSVAAVVVAALAALV